MKNGVRWLGGFLLIALLTIVAMAVLGFCPPEEGPWPQPPWCPGSPYQWPFSKQDDLAVQAPIEETEPEPQETREQALVSLAGSLFSGLSKVQIYFDQGLQGMLGFAPGRGVGLRTGTLGGGRLAWARPQVAGPYDIPDGFLAPLPEDGFIAAPPGACGAGALPRVRFNDQSGEAVTGERLAQEEVATIPFEALTGENPEGNSLESIIAAALQPGDMRLTTAEGWNEVLWEPLAAEQQPMDSLIGYQLWNTADEIETLVSDSIVSRMQAMGIPNVVIEAFQQSDQHGWFASRGSRPENQLASMEIIAEFNGAFQGTIEEVRTFALTVPGEMPEFGPMTGSGEISFDHPALGLLTFEVELAWDQWDELGRVNGGEMTMIERSAGYEIHIKFAPDGTKQGELFVDNELVGRIEMIVEGNETTMEFFPLE